MSKRAILIVSLLDSGEVGLEIDGAKAAADPVEAIAIACAILNKARVLLDNPTDRDAPSRFGEPQT